MVEFLLFAFCTYGICFGFIQKCEKIYSKFSFLEKMSSCEYCTGFWAGLISFFLVYSPIITLSWGIITISVAHAFCGAALCYMIDTVYKKLEEVQEEDDG